MSKILDSNVLLDIITADATWLGWSREQFREAANEGPIVINPVVYSELAPAFGSQRALDQWLKPTLFRRLPLPYDAAFRASVAFRAYRGRGGTKTSPLPDFYIGAQAEVEGLRLVTRDAARYRTYFPTVELITPEE